MMRPFEEFAETLATSLWGTMFVGVDEVLREPTYHEALQSILDTSEKRRDRDDKTVEDNVLLGKAIEIGVNKMLPLSRVYDEKWDKTNPHSYGKDIITKDGLRLETKHTTYERCFHISQAGHKTLTRCIQHDTMDAIVVASAKYDLESDGFNVKPHLLIEPKSYLLITEKPVAKDYHAYRTELGIKKGRARYINYTDED